MEIKELPEVRVTDDAEILARLPRKERLAKYDDNCLSKEKFAFSDELAADMVAATSPLDWFDRDR